MNKKQKKIIAGNSSDVITSSISVPERLLCEYLENPLGIGTAVPRLSWELKPLRRGACQSAWRVVAASTRDAVISGSCDLWDSGRTESAQSIHIEYAGKPLTGGQTVWWRVMVWDAEGIATVWSAPASFETGLLDESDWHGEWIAAPENISSPLMRREFTLGDKKVKRARIYVSGLGYSEIYVNGKRSGDRVLDPAWTDYDRRE
ncbi:MAG: alpha-L-rhamnosidase N-terminal domain-containing protein, partial [Victivallales bacterium]